MPEMRDSDTSRPVLTMKYLSVLGVLAALAITAYLVLAYNIRLQSGDAADINISGSQRMLLQRTALLAERLVHTRDPRARADLRAELRSALRLMETSHLALLHGNSSSKSSLRLPASVRAVYFGPPFFLDRGVREYLAQGRALASAPDQALTGNNPHLRAMEAAASGNLPSALNAVVDRYEKHSEADVAHVLRLEGEMLVVTLLALAVTGGFVFRPMAQQVRRQMRQLKEAGEYNRIIVATAADGIVTIDEQGIIESFNPAAVRMFGMAADEVLGQKVNMLMPEPYRNEHDGYLRNYFSTGQAKVIGKLREVTARRKNGSVFPIELAVSEVKPGAKRRFIGLLRDISERKRAEEVIAQARQRYVDLVNNLDVGVYRNTPGLQGAFLEVNPAMVRIFEAQSRAELLKHPVSALYPRPEARKIFNDKMSKHGFVRGEELELITLKGRPFWASITAVMKTDEQGNVYYDGMVEDVTERKQNEQAIVNLNRDLQNKLTELDAVNKELEAFSYSVSHDLRAPLRSIDGFSQALLEDYGSRMDKIGQDYLGRVRAATQRMAQLIDDLLQLSRVTRAEMVRETVNLSALARAIGEDLKATHPRRDVTLTVADGLVVEGDPRLLRIMLVNLLDNAWKFTSKHSRAEIEVGWTQYNGGPAYFVRDDGAGFDMSYSGKLFGAFQRLHAMTDFHGTGIGLATVQRIIRRHGGSVWAEGEIEKGATFYFTL